MEKTLVFGKPSGSSVAIVDYNLLHLGSRVCEASRSALMELGKNFKWKSTRKENNLPVLGVKKIGSDSLLIARILDNGDDESNRPHALRIEATELDVSEWDKSKWVFDPTAWSISDNGAVNVVCPDSQGFISHINIKSNKLFKWKIIPDSDWADYSSSIDPVSKNADKENYDLMKYGRNTHQKSKILFILSLIFNAFLLLLSWYLYFHISSIVSDFQSKKIAFDGKIKDKDAEIDKLNKGINRDAAEYKRYIGSERPEQFKNKYDALLSENGKLKDDIKRNLPPDAKSSIEEANRERDNANAQVDRVIRLLAHTAEELKSKKK